MSTGPPARAQLYGVATSTQIVPHDFASGIETLASEVLSKCFAASVVQQKQQIGRGVVHLYRITRGAHIKRHLVRKLQ